MSIFGYDKRKEIKKQLISYYTQMLSPIMGIKVKIMVVKMVKKFEKDIKASHCDILPENFGEIVVGKLYQDNPEFANYFVDKALADGATREDIIEYYNLDYLQKLMVEWSEEIFRYASFLSFKDDKKLSDDDAILRERMMFPMYGDPTDTSHTQGNDRPLTPALRGRVDSYRESHDVYSIQQQVSKYSSYNAFVRAEIISGHL